jgi:hypothetical protein
VVTVPEAITFLLLLSTPTMRRGLGLLLTELSVKLAPASALVSVTSTATVLV